MFDVEIEDIIKHRRPIASVAASAIYFLLDGEEVVYVGQSSNVYARVVAHHQKDCFVFDSFTFLICAPHERTDIEEFYVLKFAPRYNRILPRVRRSVYVGTCPGPNGILESGAVVIGGKMYIPKPLTAVQVDNDDLPF